MNHSEETKKKIGIANKGKLKGIPRKIESVLRGSEKRKRGAFFECLICTKSFWRQPSAIKKGQNKYCSKLCYQQSQIGKQKSESFIEFCKSRKGEKSPTWMGGITKESMKIRNSKEYREWRLAVFTRDNFSCKKCSARTVSGNYVYLHPHHIKQFSLFPDLRFSIENGITLCKPCHYKEHTNDRI